MRHVWFGDSWLVGDELELTVNMDERDQYVFPTLISNHFSAECVNLGVSGTGPDSIPLAFSKIVDELKEDDVVFFCLSAIHRTALLDDNGDMKTIIPGSNHNDHCHPNSDLWYKYFDSDPQSVLNYDKTISLLGLWCNSLNIQHYFVNIFTTVNTSTPVDVVKDNNWLLPKDQCLAQLILHSIDNENGVVVGDDMPFLKVADWDIHKEMLEKYVRPGYCHPNVDGHVKIANNIITLLEA